MQWYKSMRVWHKLCGLRVYVNIIGITIYIDIIHSTTNNIINVIIQIKKSLFLKSLLWLLLFWLL